MRFCDDNRMMVGMLYDSVRVCEVTFVVTVLKTNPPSFIAL